VAPTARHFIQNQSFLTKSPGLVIKYFMSILLKETAEFLKSLNVMRMHLSHDKLSRKSFGLVSLRHLQFFSISTE